MVETHTMIILCHHSTKWCQRNTWEIITNIKITAILMIWWWSRDHKLIVSIMMIYKHLIQGLMTNI